MSDFHNPGDHQDSGFVDFLPPSTSEYRVYRVEEEVSHDLFVIKLQGRSLEKGGVPEFYKHLQPILEGIINADHEYREERTQLGRTFYNELRRETFAWSNYIESLTLKLAIWAADLQRQLKALSRDTCFIARREAPHEYAFHISGCDQYLSMGDYLIATNHDTETIFIGNVKTVGLTEVVARMPNEFDLRVDGKNVELSFGIRWTPFIIQENCLRNTVNELGQHVLFPDRAVSRRALVQVTNREAWEWHNPLMNQNQRDAVFNCLQAKCRPLPYLVSGPPGTGKTSTLIEYVHQVYRHLPSSKILICAPSNTAANVVLQMLTQSNWIKGDVIRMVSYSHIISGTLPRRLRQFCGTLKMPDPPAEMKIIEDLADLTRYRVVVTTVNYSGNFMRMGLTRHFTHLVVDEAGQALETETLIPMALMRRPTAHITMFGDEKQLGPVVLYHALRKLHFDVSLFERLSLRPVYFQTPELYSRLLNNYRSVPQLLKFYNELFYMERLIPMVTDPQLEEFRLLDRLERLFPQSYVRRRYCGLYFMNVNTPCFKEPTTWSWFNPGEKGKLLAFYKKLLENRVKAADIGIVTPYRAQHREIVAELIRMKLPHPKVGTVEIFQGDQRMVMLMSPVRSFAEGSRSTKNISLGFVNDPKRINVAISRARSLLVIFGNKEVLSGCDHWNKLIRIADSDSTLVI